MGLTDFFLCRQSGSGKSHDGGESREVQEVVGEGMAFKEDQFLTSANLCRWVIDFKVVQLGDQVSLSLLATWPWLTCLRTLTARVG
jgi:hypothetical protein